MVGIDVLEQHIANREFDLLRILAKDKTTGRFIKWATENYASYGHGYKPEDEMNPKLIIGRMTNIIQPRVLKSTKEQLQRTKDKAEVFTPTWIVNNQNNLIDDAWFGRSGVFNFTKGKIRKTNDEKVLFPQGKTWQQYINLRRLEISCGEAPYLVNRYDAVTGEYIDVKDRVGLLDRKLRIINENVDNEIEWNEWVIKAFQSIYGYEYQGDNVLFARENLLYTYLDNMIFKFGKEPSLSQQTKIANIIVWNIWQMDGITMTIPYSSTNIKNEQMSIFDITGWGENQKKEEVLEAIPCRIFDWRANKSIEFRSMIQGG